MARMYAAVLGPLAMLTSLTHGMLHARNPDDTLRAAWGWLLAFALLGALVGALAGWMVEESVSATVARELETAKRSNQPRGAKN